MAATKRSDSVPAVSNELLRRMRLSAVAVASTVALAACGSTRDNNILGYRNGVAPDGNGLSTLEVVAIFVLVPLVLLLGIAALVWLPGVVRGSRYRPSAGWSPAPMWFGGPPDPVAAVEAASVGELTRGGAGGSW